MENITRTVYLCNPITLLVLRVFLVIHYATTNLNHCDKIVANIYTTLCKMQQIPVYYMHNVLRIEKLL